MSKFKIAATLKSSTAEKPATKEDFVAGASMVRSAPHPASPRGGEGPAYWSPNYIAG
jgi:hypothetical protein